MADSDAEKERRRHPRVPIKKRVRAVAKAEHYHGSVKDISASGAAIRLDVQIEGDRVVELDIEDLSPLSGRVARSLDDGVAVEFDIDEDEEERLIEEIREIRDSMRGDDE